MGGVHFLDRRKLTYCYLKKKKKKKKQVYPLKPLAAHVREPQTVSHVEAHTTQGQWGQEVGEIAAK